ncbi:MAG: hypothetical protein HQK49_00765 [Oligoflexia bacterium]|nr:hypothetical protein [Oligoflexia bacterium]
MRLKTIYFTTILTFITVIATTSITSATATTAARITDKITLKKFEVLNSNKYSFSFRDACDLFGYKNLPLIDPAGSSNIDCMGAKVSISAFCNKKLLQEDVRSKFMRAIIDKEKRKIICQTGDRVILGVLCNNKNFCKEDPFMECNRLRKLLAQNLTLLHQSITTTATDSTSEEQLSSSTNEEIKVNVNVNKKSKLLNCYFVSDKYIQDDELLINNSKL